MGHLTAPRRNQTGLPCVFTYVELSETSARRPARRPVLVGSALLAVVVLLLSPYVGRAEPVGSYRPPLPPDALSDGCWPLPGGVRLDFGYQVRTDEVVATTHGPRRQLVVHYDEVDGAEATRRTEAAFAAAGVADAVVVAHDFEDTLPGAVVRGQMVLDLPPSEPGRRPACQDPFSTKDFEPPIDDRS